MSKWYLYENEEVVGPFEPSGLSGRIDEDTLVCRAGQEEWNHAGKVPELQSILREDEREQPDSGGEQTPESQSEDTEEEIIEPTLENLRSICEKASDRNLLEEHEQHLDEYDEYERRILREELERRGLTGQTHSSG
jgi:hypothetical protein